MHGLEGNWTPYGGMQIAEDYQAFNLGIGKDLGLFGAFSFDITQANTTLADGTRQSTIADYFLSQPLCLYVPVSMAVQQVFAQATAHSGA